MYWTHLINSIRCNCCKWKYRYRSLSSNHGCSWLTKCVASWMRPLWTASRMRIRLSNVFNGTDGSTPASAWNFSAAFLNPSVDFYGTKKIQKSNVKKKIVKLFLLLQICTHQSPNSSWSIYSYQLVWIRNFLNAIAILLLLLVLVCHYCWK